MSEQPNVNALAAVLLNESTEFGDRDDAAIALASSDSPDAEKALLKIATDASADVDLADRCGESLAYIWSRRGHVDERTISSLNDVARHVALETIKAMSPEMTRKFGKQGIDRSSL